MAIYVRVKLGELAGLRWEDVDLTHEEICVCGQLVSDFSMDDDLDFKNKGLKRVEHLKSDEAMQQRPAEKVEKPIFSLVG